MLEEAFFRSVRAVVPKTLDELRLPRKEVVLYVHMPGCGSCADFAPRRADYERKRGWERVVDWSGAHKRRRQLAIEAGVGDLPAYVVVPPRTSPQQPVRVVRPT
jgi:hypothetical protein